MKKVLLIILIWSFAIFFLNKITNIYEADKLLEKSERSLSKLDTRTALRLINKAIEKNSYEPNYFRIKAKILLVGNMSKEDTLNNLKKSLELNPNNLVTIRNSVPLYYFLASKDLSLPSGYDNLDEQYVPAVRDFFGFVKDKYPNDAGVISLLAKYEKKIGFTDDYLSSVEMVRKLRPDLLEWNESFR